MDVLKCQHKQTCLFLFLFSWDKNNTQAIFLCLARETLDLMAWLQWLKNMDKRKPGKSGYRCDERDHGEGG